jgi:hypothetical protein
MLQRFHSCWLDLRTQLLALATSSGAPVMRHMFFHYWQGLSLSDMPSQALELSQTQVSQALPVLSLLRDVLINCVSVPSWRLAPRCTWCVLQRWWDLLVSISDVQLWFKLCDCLFVPAHISAPASVLSESSTTVTTLLPPGLWVRSWSMQVTSRRLVHFISVISISEEL